MNSQHIMPGRLRGPGCPRAQISHSLTSGHVSECHWLYASNHRHGVLSVHDQLQLQPCKRYFSLSSDVGLGKGWWLTLILRICECRPLLPSSSARKYSCADDKLLPDPPQTPGTCSSGRAHCIPCLCSQPVVPRLHGVRRFRCDICFVLFESLHQLRHCDHEYAVRSLGELEPGTWRVELGQDRAIHQRLCAGIHFLGHHIPAFPLDDTCHGE